MPTVPAGAKGLALKFLTYLTGRVVAGFPFDRREENSRKGLRIRFYLQTSPF